MKISVRYVDVTGVAESRQIRTELLPRYSGQIWVFPDGPILNSEIATSRQGQEFVIPLVPYLVALEPVVAMGAVAEFVAKLVGVCNDTGNLVRELIVVIGAPIVTVNTDAGDRLRVFLGGAALIT